MVPAAAIPVFAGYRPVPGAELQRRAPVLPPTDLTEALSESDPIVIRCTVA
jgi:hypothetical protein